MADLYKRSITVDYTKVGSPLTDFPVYVSFTVGSNSANANGYDVHFQTDAGVDLVHELTSWNNTTKVWSGWVKVPSLSNSVNTVITALYGDTARTTNTSSTTVWSSQYVGVWHLNEASGIVNDSKGTLNLEPHNGSPTYGVAGKTGNAVTLSGGPRFRSNAIDTTHDFGTGAFWTSGWFKSSGSSTYSGIVGHLNETTTLGFTLELNINKVEFWVNGSSMPAPANYNDNNWHHFYAERDSGGTLHTFVDGANVINSGVGAFGGNVNSSGRMWIGGWNETNSYPFNGTITEIRTGTGVRSAAWVTTEYNNQNDPTTFSATGSETTIAPPPITGIKAWFKSDSITGLLNGQAVTSWSDATGVYTATSTSGHPVYRTNMINGYPSVRINGSTGMDVAGLGMAGASWTVFAIVRPENNSGEKYIIRGTGDYNVDFFYSGSSRRVDRGATGLGQSTGISVGFGSPLVTGFEAVALSYGYAGTGTGDMEGWLNGELKTTSDSGSVNFGSGANARIGNGGKNLDIVEIIWVERKLNSTEQAALANYAKAKYGIGNPPVAEFPTSALMGRYEANLQPVLSDGATMSTLLDQSGNNFHLFQMSTAQTYKTNIINSKPAYYFAGTGGYQASGTDYGAFVDAGAPELTISMVVNSNNPGGSRTWPLGSYVADSASIFAFTDGSQAGKWNAFLRGANNSSQIYFSTTDDTVWGVLTMTLGNGFVKAYYNGTEVYSAVTTGTQQMNQFKIASNLSQVWEGYMAVGAIWKKSLTDTERAQYHSYVQDTYGITVSDYISSSSGPVIKRYTGTEWVLVQRNKIA